MAAQPPPPHGDHNRGPEILAASISTVIIAIIAVTLRVYDRLFIKKSFGWDDAAIVIALFVAIIGMVFNILECHHGNGRHMYYLPPTEQIQAFKYNILSQIQSVIGGYFTKLSICLFLLRLVDGTHRKFSRCVYAFIVLLSSVYWVLIIISFIQCVPLKAKWDPRVQGKCIPGNVIIGMVYLQSAFSVVTDVICALSPMYFIKHLNIAKFQKISIMLLIGLGLLTSAAGLCKMVFLPQLFANVRDYTWVTVDVSLCALIEENIGVTIATLPALKQIFKRTLEYTGLSSKSSGFTGQTSTSKGSTWSSHKTFGNLQSYKNPAENHSGKVSDDDVLLDNMNIKKTTQFEMVSEITHEQSKSYDWEHDLER